MPSHNCIIITMFSFQGAFELQRNSMKYLFPGTSVNFFELVEISGIEPLTSCLQGRRSPSWAKPPYPFSFCKKWWAKDSLSCGKATAVATVHRTVAKSRLSSPFWLANLSDLDRLGLNFSFALFMKWWAKMDSNHRPHDYQSCALASWAIGPFLSFSLLRYTNRCTL